MAKQFKFGFVIEGDAEKGTKALRKVREEVVGLDKEASKAKTGTNSWRDATNKQTKALDAHSKTLDRARNMVLGLAGAMGAGMLLGRFKDTIVETEKLRGSLVTMTGSQVAAAAAFDNLNKFAAETPFTLNQSVEGFIKLKALGLDPSERALRSYGNTAAAMGKEMSQMIEAVADASTGEFERLKEFGIKASKQGDDVALTFQGITTTIRNDSEAIQEYLMRIGEVQFGRAMEDQMERLPGLLSNLEDSVDGLFRKLGDSGGISIFGDGVKFATSAVQGLTENSDTLITVAEALAVLMGGRFVGSMGAAAASMISAQGAAVGLRRALSLLGGPAGITMVATGIAWGFVEVQKREAEEAWAVVEAIDAKTEALGTLSKVQLAESIQAQEAHIASLKAEHERLSQVAKMHAAAAVAHAERIHFLELQIPAEEGALRVMQAHLRNGLKPLTQATEENNAVTEESITNAQFLEDLHRRMPGSIGLTESAYLDLMGVTDDLGDSVESAAGQVKDLGTTTNEVSDAMIRDIQNLRQSFGEFFADLFMNIGDAGDLFDGLAKSWARTGLQMLGNDIFNAGAGMLGLPKAAGPSLLPSLMSAGSALLPGAMGAGGVGAFNATTGFWAAPSMLAPGAGAAGGAAGAGGLSGALGAIPGWGWALLAAGGLAAAFSKKKTPSFNAGMLLHGLPGVDGQFAVDPFASGLRPVGFSRRADDAESRQVIDTFRTLDQSVVDLVRLLGGTVSANRGTFTGLDERGMSTGLFFGAAGEKGKPGMALDQQLDLYVRQLTTAIEGLDEELLASVRSASSAEEALSLLSKAVEDHALETEKAALAEADAAKAAEEATQRYSAALTGLKAIIDPIEDGIKSLARTLQEDIYGLLGATVLRPGGLTISEQTKHLADLRDQAWENHREELRLKEEAHRKSIDLARSLTQAMTDLRLGNLSPLNNAGKLDIARAQFRSTLSAALGGDVDAAGRLQGAAQAFAEQSQGMFASSSPHKGNMAEILAGLEQAAGVMGASKFDPQQANNALIAELQQINEQLKLLPGQMAGELAPQIAAFVQVARGAGIKDEFIANAIKSQGATAIAAADPALIAQATSADAMRSVIDFARGNFGTELEAMQFIAEKARKANVSSSLLVADGLITEEQRQRGLGILAAAGLPGFANGVRNFEGGLAWVGERGPEIAHLPTGTNVYSNQQSMGMVRAANDDSHWAEVKSLLKDVVRAIASTGSVDSTKLDRIADTLENIDNKTERAGIGSGRYSGNAA